MHNFKCNLHAVIPYITTTPVYSEWKVNDFAAFKFPNYFSSWNKLLLIKHIPSSAETSVFVK